MTNGPDGGETAIDPDWITDRRVPPATLDAPGLRSVLDALGGAAFLVGGSVRNALLGTPTSDVDLSTPLDPEAVTRRLEAAGLKAVPTGLAHGTVTAVADGAGVEVTTFRRDVETDGRRAVVAFSGDMAEDARRRDFTMNALYADAEGRVIDPLGGLPDLDARRVRFIGDAQGRIREDFLRILRFFRFSATYAARDAACPDGVDPDGLAACAALAEGIDGLARERIGHEIRRLLAAADPAPAVAAMARSGVLARCLPGADAGRLGALVATERAACADWPLRLAALTADTDATETAERLRLSKAETKTLAAMLRARENLLSTARPEITAGGLARREGAQAARAGVLLVLADGRALDRAACSAVIERGASVSFPLVAKDLVAHGIAPGPDLGRRLAAAETAWIESGFSLDKSALLTQFGDPSREV